MSSSISVTWETVVQKLAAFDTMLLGDMDTQYYDVARDMALCAYERNASLIPFMQYMAQDEQQPQQTVDWARDGF